jgi:hypothetical protein
MKHLFDSTFWRQFRIVNHLHVRKELIQEGEEGLPNVNELQQEPVSPARIDFWAYSMRELESMYQRLFGVVPVHKSKEQLVESLVSGHIC